MRSFIYIYTYIDTYYLLIVILQFDTICIIISIINLLHKYWEIHYREMVVTHK